MIDSSVDILVMAFGLYGMGQFKHHHDKDLLQ
jgi:hypothetical protein